MSTVSFTYGSTTVTIQAPKYPDEPGRDYPQTVGRTMGGGFKVADLGDGTAWERPRLPFRAMSDADYTALKGFIETTVGYSGAGFSYVDGYGTTHTNMRYLTGLKSFLRTKGRWSGTIEMAKDMSA